MAVTKLNLSGPRLAEAYATFTHTEGETEETLTVGGYVMSAVVQHVVASGELITIPTVSISRSTTTGISTITINYTETVTDGRIIVRYIPS